MDYFCVKWKFRRTNWICTMELAKDPIDDPAFLSPQVIEIKQPDSATLSICVSDNPSIQPRVLTRGHRDFECDSYWVNQGIAAANRGNLDFAIRNYDKAIGI